VTTRKLTYLLRHVERAPHAQQASALRDGNSIRWRRTSAPPAAQELSHERPGRFTASGSSRG
jgi:hypothetical protein